MIRRKKTGLKMAGFCYKQENKQEKENRSKAR